MKQKKLWGLISATCLLLAIIFNIPTIQSVSAETTITFDNDHSSYYEQIEHYDDSVLTKSIKHIYDGLVAEKSRFINGVEEISLASYFGSDMSSFFYLSSENRNRAITTAFSMFLYDHPEMFYIDTTKMTFSMSKANFIVKKQELLQNYYIDGFTSQSQVSTAITAVTNIRNTIISTIPADATDFEKVQIVHNYIVDNVEYSEDLDADFIHTLYGALNNNICVCDGYSTALKYVLDQIGIDCIVVTGITGVDPELTRHMWNYVKLYGSWYAIDATWDDPVIPESFSEAQKISLKNAHRYDHFLKGTQDSTDPDDFYYHRIIENINLTGSNNLVTPTLSENDYTETTLTINHNGILILPYAQPITFTPETTNFNPDSMEYAYSVSKDNGETWSDWKTFSETFIAKRPNQNGLYKFRIQTKGSKPRQVVVDDTTYKVNLSIEPIYYNITKTDLEGVEYTTNAITAEEEDIITITITTTPENKIVSKVEDTTNNITLTKVNSTTFTLSMPAHDVNIQVTLADKPITPPEEETEEDPTDITPTEGFDLAAFIIEYKQYFIYGAIALGGLLVLSICISIIKHSR